MGNLAPAGVITLIFPYHYLSHTVCVGECVCMGGDTLFVLPQKVPHQDLFQVSSRKYYLHSVEQT